MVEETDDVFDDLLNRLGIYGACGESCTKENPCRSHAEAYWRKRMMAAVEVEQKLNARQDKGNAVQQPITKVKTPVEEPTPDGEICPECSRELLQPPDENGVYKCRYDMVCGWSGKLPLT